MIPSQKVGVVTSEMVRYSRRNDTETDFIAHTMALIKKMVKFGYEKRKVMRKVQNFRHFPRNLGRWSRTRRRIMDTFNDWYNAINAEHRWRRQNHCHNGPRWGTRWRTSKKQHTTHHIDTPHIPHTSRLSFVSFCQWINFFGLPIKSYSGLRLLVYKNTHSKNLTRGLRPIELLGCTCALLGLGPYLVHQLWPRVELFFAKNLFHRLGYYESSASPPILLGKFY